MRRESKTMATDFAALFRRAAESPNDPGVLDELKRNAALILAEVKAGRLDLPKGDETWTTDRQERLAMVYEALAGTEELPAEDVAMLEAMDMAAEEDEAKVREAFELLPDRLREEPLVKLAVQIQSSPGFLTTDLPVIVHYAADAVTRVGQHLSAEAATAADVPSGVPSAVGMFVRTYRECTRGKPGEGDVYLSLSPSRLGRPVVPVDLIVGEIAKTVECNLSQAGHLFEWMLDAAQVRPYFFDGFVATEDQDAVRLTPLAKGTTMILSQRWGLDEVIRHHEPLVNHERSFV